MYAAKNYAVLYLRRFGGITEKRADIGFLRKNGRHIYCLSLNNFTFFRSCLFAQNEGYKRRFFGVQRFEKTAQSLFDFP